MSLVLTADFLAERLHAGQLDKQGKPYIEHPRRVAAMLEMAPEHPNIIAAALLHDVLEDTEATPELLKAEGIPDEVIDLVKVLTRDKANETYGAFIERVAQNPIATRIKLADLLDNSDPTRGLIKESLRVRYHDALKRLVLGV